MEKGLAYYIWRHTKRQQLWILCIVFLSMIPYFLSFDLPKRIVNGPIQGQGFDKPDATQLFMHTEFSLPLVGNVVLFPGIDLNRFQTLYALSAVFLLLVVVNGLFKLYINTYKGRLGERLLRRIRYELIDRMLRFPPARFKRLKGAEIASMVKDEVEPLGGFTGDAFVQPALLGGQALTAMFFIFVQNFWLGLISAIIVVVQGVLIPRMRRRQLLLGRQRQLTARELAGRVSEIVDGIHTIHALDTVNYERADIASRLGKIFKIRYDLYQWKFLVKFINNFLASFTPFLFYCIGGYLALTGKLDIGQLVAVISAYKDLPGPLNDLISWDQARQDVQVKYAQVVDEFRVEPLIEPAIVEVSAKDHDPIEEPIVVSNLTLIDDSGVKLLENASLKIERPQTYAFVGAGAAGGEALAEALGRVIWPETGRISIGATDLLHMPESIVGRRLTYASSDMYFFHGTLRDNLLYGLKHAPFKEPEYDGERARHRKWEISEAIAAGNTEYDIDCDWIDYKGAGARGPEDLYHSVAQVLDTLDLSTEILEFALRTNVDAERHPMLTGRIVEMRKAFRRRMSENGMKNYVVFFEPDAYNSEATIGENLLFGNIVNPELMGRSIGKNAYFRKVIIQSGLAQILYDVGRAIAGNIVELFSDLPGDHPFFQQLTLMSADDIPQYEQLLQKTRGVEIGALSEEDRTSFIRLSFGYVEPRYRFGLLTPEIKERIIQVRKDFHEGMPEDMRNDFERYDPGKFTASASLLDNILFGRIANRIADAQEKVRAIVIDMLSEPALYEQVLAIGLEFHVGAGGRRLTLVQRQMLNLARALLRHSDYYVFNHPLAALDQRHKEKLARRVMAFLRETRPDAGIVWVLSDAKLSTLFDRVAVFDRGQLVEEGTYETLVQKNKLFKELV